MPAQYGSKWKTSGPKVLEDVPLPSGETVLARRPGVQGLIAAGVINDLDALTGLVETKHNQRVNPSKKAKGRGVKPTTPNDLDEARAIKALMAEEGKLENVMRVADKVAAYCVVRPTLRIHWRDSEDPRDGTVISLDIPDEDRDRTPNPEYPEDPVLYTDEVDMEDKIFLMNYAVGGTRDLEQFRTELGESVASMESV